MDRKDILERYYTTPKNPGAFSGPLKLFSALEKRYPGKFTLTFVKDWLTDKESYALQKPARHRFKTARVRVTRMNEQFDVDLLSMENLSSDNDGVRFLLCCVDILSRKLRVRPLKNKTTSVVAEGMRDILKEVVPKKIRSDSGMEFKGKSFQSLMKEYGIYHFTVSSENKSNYVERIQRTVKSMIYRMMRERRSYRYVDDLQDIVSNYNDLEHQSLNGMSPNQINSSNEADIWSHLYLKKGSGVKSRPIFKFKVGDLVRVSFAKHVFRRSYNEQYSSEVFRITGRLLKQGLPMYRLHDLMKEPIKGLFYTSELLIVNKDEDSLWFIESILKKRKRNKKTFYWVKWSGFSDRYNSWVAEEDVKDISTSGSDVIDKGN